MSIPSFSKLVTKKQYRRALKPLKAIKEVTGLDCEVRDDGYAFLICDDIGNYQVINCFDDVISFLTRKRFRDKLNCFYNIKYDFNSLIKWLGKDKCFELYKNLKTTYKDWIVCFIPSKVFKLKKGHKTYSFYDIAQFFSFMELGEASKNFLGEEKYEIETKNFTQEFIERNFDRIRDYCLRDAYLTSKLADFIVFSFYRIGAEVRDLISPASIAQRYFRQKCFIPKIDKIPEGARYYAYNCYHGGWFEVFVKGYFPKLYQYDVNSAYPAEIANLPTLKGRWIKTLGTYPHEAKYGYIYAEVDIDITALSPIAISSKWGNYYPASSFRTFVTKAEFDFINEHLGNARVIEGWWFKPVSDEKPFKAEIEKLFKLKQEAEAKEDLLTAFSCKSLMNSFYGKFFQKNSNGETYYTGQLFNPVYATEITANARLRIARAILDYKDKVVMIATDAIFTTEPIPLNSGNTLGGFKLVNEGEGVIIGSGVYTIWGKELKSRFRGFIATEKYNWFEILEKEAMNGDSNIITLKVKKAVTLGEALATDFERLGRFEEQERKLSLNFDQKRIWRGEFKNASQALKEQIKSIPMPYFFF